VLAGEGTMLQSSITIVGLKSGLLIFVGLGMMGRRLV
jgi:hypothetical protein